MANWYNKSLKILVTAIIALTMVAVYFLFIRKSNNQVLSKVPGDATSVIVVDVRSLSGKLLIDDFGKGLKNSAAVLARWLTDSTATTNLPDNGIGFPDKLALFTLEDSAAVKLYLIVPLSNSKKFDQWVRFLGQQLKFTVEKSDGMQWAYTPKPGILLAWDDKFACAMYTPQYTHKELNTISRILSCRPKQSIMADTCFARQLTSAFDIMVYSRNYRKCPVKKLEMLNDHMEYGVSFIRFEAGEVTIHSVIHPKSNSALSKLFAQSNAPMPVLASNAQAPISFRLQVNPTIFRQLYNQYKPMDVTTHLEGYPDVWDGRLALALNGVKTTENKYTTYAYDDNFNKVAITKVKKDTMLDVQLVAGVRNEGISHLQPIVNGNDTLLFTGGNMVVKKVGQFFAVYDKSCPKPTFSEAPVHNQMELSIIYPPLSALLKGMGLTSKTAYLDSIGLNNISITAHQSRVLDVVSTFLFLDMKRNAFYIVLEKGCLKAKQQ